METKTLPSGGPVVGVQPQAVFLQPLGQPRTVEHYKSKQSKILGIIQIVTGIVILVLSCVLMKFADRGSPTERMVGYQAFFCLIFYCLSGGFAISAGKRRTQCTIISHLVFAILACLTTLSLISGIISNIVINSIELRDEWRGGFRDDVVYPDYRDYGPWDEEEPTTPEIMIDIAELEPTRCWFFGGGDDRRIKANIATSSLVLILTLVQFVATIWSSTLGCRSMCCPKYLPTNATGQPHIVMINGQTFTMATGPATTIAPNQQADPLPEKQDLNDFQGITVSPASPPPPYL